MKDKCLSTSVFVHVRLFVYLPVASCVFPNLSVWLSVRFVDLFPCLLVFIFANLYVACGPAYLPQHPTYDNTLLTPVEPLIYNSLSTQGDTTLSHPLHQLPSHISRIAKPASSNLHPNGNILLVSPFTKTKKKEKKRNITNWSIEEKNYLTLTTVHRLIFFFFLTD